jgi:hypothetical protein
MGQGSEARGLGLARHDGDLHAEGHQRLSLPELLRLFGDEADEAGRSREAIACYLAGGDGWREAAKRLDGAFAEHGTGLKARQKD